jgi:hypothetical protein
MLPLEASNPHRRDGAISFDPERHQYTVTRASGVEKVPVSVTSFSKAYFKQFDAAAVIHAHFSKWKQNVNSKYYAIIHATIQTGGSDDDAKSAIAASWVSNAKAASSAGTAMHDRAEKLCNGLHVENDAEMRMLRTWLASFQPAMDWKPYRTEWKLWYDEPRLGGNVLVAGTLDLLLHSKTTGKFALVDFKRCNSTPHLLGPCSNPRFHPGYARSPLVAVEDSKFGAYTMQLNILAKILEDRYAIFVDTDMYLLQIHESLKEAHCVQVESHRAATSSLFMIEAEMRIQNVA